MVGTCAHIASVLWFLGYQRHTEVGIPKGGMIDCVLNAADVPHTDSESDAEDPEQTNNCIEEE